MRQQTRIGNELTTVEGEREKNKRRVRIEDEQIRREKNKVRGRVGGTNKRSKSK